MNSGIYEILNTTNGRRYVGSAQNINERLKKHVRLLKAGDHHSIHLQRAWDKAGNEAFQFKPLLFCARTDLLLYEQLSMAALKPEYNIATVAGSPMSGRRHSQKTLEKMSQTRKGVKKPPGFSERVRELVMGNTYWAGRKHKPETIAKMKAAATGRGHTAATKEKLRQINLGKKRTGASLG